jgi:FkbM family methyltransferase
MMNDGARARLNRIYVRSRLRFYRLRGRLHYYGQTARRRAYERLGSERHSRPAIHGLDAALEERLPRRPGVFVEAGAFDGVFASNTYYLERFRGWTGVLVEPLPKQYRRCVRERPNSRVFNCALVDDDSRTSVTLRCEDPMSAVTDIPLREVDPVLAETWGLHDLEVIEVPARTLTSVLEEAGATSIDFLSLDVEGFEPQVLRGLDFERFQPEWLLIEHGQDVQRKKDIEAELPSAYEPAAEISSMDTLYVRRSAAPC